jgi:hypothetical protein
MGVVYDAWDTSLERQIALKELTLPGGLAPEIQEEMIERFGREARAAAKLSHPNVVLVHDVFSEGDRYFIAMERLQGASLADYVDEGGMPQEAALHVLVQILDAVHAAHEQGIVHRDIKPDNIFVLPDGRVKVTDFGIAKVMDSSANAAMTQIGTMIGTPGYMAPEQVMGAPVDRRADVFSVGVVGYELLSGTDPFAAESTTATLYRIVHEDCAPLGAYGVSEVLGAIVGRALAKDPEGRYQSAAEMASDLRQGVFTASSAVSHGVAPGANPGTHGPHKSGGRTGVIVVSAVLVCAVVLAALVLFASPGTVPGNGGATSSSAAESKVVVPSVVNMALSDAEAAVRGKGLIPTRQTRASEMPENTVLEQYPAAGAMASRQGTVALTVAIEAPAPATVPAPSPTRPAGTAGVIVGSYTPGWTVVYNSMKSKSQAMSAYREIKAQGEDAGVIDTDYFTREKGVDMVSDYYAVVFGHYGSKAEAAAVAKRYASNDCYARWTEPK